MPEQTSPNHARQSLHPARSPFKTQTLDVGHGHQIYIDQSGNPKGTPVVVLHGGPGGGCSPGMRRYFHPDAYHTILFDQRGCGRSTPFATTENNTTWDLVADIERIRISLGIEKWIVFGGSWGATLSLLYAQTHPERVTALVLRGVFTMTKAELNWFYGGPAGDFWPEAWAKFKNMVPVAEQNDLISAYKSRLFGPDHTEIDRFASAWTAWENTLASLQSDGHGSVPAARYARAFARIENHYFSHQGWLECDDQIMRDMPKLQDIKGYIVQGRYDMVCPPHTAHKIHKAWPGSELRIVTEAGHAMSEPGITRELVDIMNEIAHDW